jgi:hypothetical protein
MMRTVLALFLFLHGIAHLPGFLVAWQLRSFPDMPFRTTIFAGPLDVGHAGIRAIGVAWLVTAFAFALTAAGVLMRAKCWQPIAYATITGSVLLTVAGWPDARFGLIANALIVILIVMGHRLGWL